MINVKKYKTQHVYIIFYTYTFLTISKQYCVIFARVSLL